MRRRECKAQTTRSNGCRVLAPRSRRAGCLLGAALLIGLGGCGLPIITFQAEGTAEAGADTKTANAKAVAAAEPATTGSIDRKPLGFGADLGAEDWRRASAALAVALDPQGNGRPVKWDNPETTLRGSVNPTGLPYVSNDLVCRDFLASIISRRAAGSCGAQAASPPVANGT